MRSRTAGAALLTAVLVSLAFVGEAAGEQALDGDIWGYFRPAKRPATAFAEVAELHLAGRGAYGWKASPPYYGMIKTSGKRAATYRLNQPVIEGLRITFTTEMLRGVSYSFSGVLARGDFSGGGIPIEEVTLRGSIRRLKNGGESAAADMQFVLEPGG